MWWINKSGVVEGPFSAEQMQKRVKLNMLRSLDRVSEDKAKWFYVRDTIFWNPTRTIKVPEPPPPPPSRSSRPITSSGSRNAEPDMDFDGPIMARPAEPVSSGRVPIPDRLRIDPYAAKPSSNKGLWITLITIIVLALLGFGIMAYFMLKNATPKTAPEDSPADVAEPEEEAPPALQIGFNAVKDKLVIIECLEGSGSGFLLEMDGKTYLMSNEHVLRSTSAPRAKLLDGTPLNLGAFSVATDRDLARFEVNGCSIKPFQISKVMPNVGDSVALYGNSLGGGVATESKGYIQGVGHHRIEANVEIVHGNSGSPLVATDGKVLGVAAFMKYNGDGGEDWTIKNTRYDGNVRRFSIRFTNVEWKTIDRTRYEEQVASMKEFETYWQYLLPYLCYENTKVEEGRLVFNDLKSKDFYRHKYGFEEILMTLSKAYKKMNKSYDSWSERTKARKIFIQRLIDNEMSEEDGKRALEEYDKKTVELFEKFKEARRNMILKRKEALSCAQSFLAETSWESPNMINGYSSDNVRESIKWYRNGIQYFVDLMNQMLKDFNKLMEQIEKGDDDEEDE